MRKALAAAIKRDTARKRDQMREHFARLGSNPNRDDAIAMNRQVNTVVDGHALQACPDLT